MALDGVPAPPSTAPTPLYTPMPSGVSTPQSGGPVGEYLTVPLHKWESPKIYLGGSKALDSLARLIASTEHFFHPANSGSWTSDVRCSFRWTWIFTGFLNDTATIANPIV
jgi:proteasome activator subunit 4